MRYYPAHIMHVYKRKIMHLWVHLKILRHMETHGNVWVPRLMALLSCGREQEAAINKNVTHWALYVCDGEFLPASHRQWDRNECESAAAERTTRFCRILVWSEKEENGAEDVTENLVRLAGNWTWTRHSAVLSLKVLAEGWVFFGRNWHKEENLSLLWKENVAL